jgi:hypothetical protein
LFTSCLMTIKWDIIIWDSESHGIWIWMVWIIMGCGKSCFFLILDSISISHDYPIMIPNGILIRMLIFHQILALSHGRNMGPPFGWSFIGLV